MSATERRDVELSRLLDDLSRLRLPIEEWEVVSRDLALVGGDADDRVDRVSQIVFEANVQGRFHGGRAASTLPPTKQTSALPWVGLFCALLLLAVGGALGGGVVLLIVAALAAGVTGIFFFPVVVSFISHLEGVLIFDHQHRGSWPLARLDVSGGL